MTKEEKQQLKQKVALGVRVLVAEGIIENRGHVSARLPEEGLICLPGHIHLEGRTLGDITTEEVLIADMDGRTVEGDFEPPDEVFIHTEIYRKRPEVKSVVHTHSPMATAFSIARKPILPVILEGAIFAKGVPIYEKGGRIVTREQGIEVASILGLNWAVLLRGHGTVNVGTCIEQACVLAVHLEKTAKMQYTAEQLGAVTAHDPADFGWDFILGSDYYNPTWAFLVGKTSKKS